MDVKLKVLVGKNAGQELAVPGPKFFVGRAEDCQLRPRSDLISRHHCVLLIEEGFIAVRDFGSKNGTLVNDERITGERELKHGDRLVIGPLEFELVVHAPAPSKKRPKVESVKEAAARTAEGHRESDKLDVSQWLGDGDSKVGNADTRVINMNETGELDLGNGHAKQAAAHTATVEAEPEEPEPVAASQPAAAKAAPGKLPATAKPAQDDSRSAAADVLNKFFKRR